MDNQHSGGSFLTGFIAGMAVGALGYFFLKTDEGKRARSQLAQEWYRVQEDLSINQGSAVTIKSFKEAVLEWFEEMMKVEQKKSVKATVLSKPQKVKTSRKFKKRS